MEAVMYSQGILIQSLLMVLRNGALETVVCEARMPSKPSRSRRTI